jgi:hypothetical protein
LTGKFSLRYIDVVDTNRKRWNLGQQQLRESLTKATDLQKAIKLFLVQHAMVHSSRISKEKFYSFEDEIFRDATDEIIRRFPKNSGHSIAWIIWHLARIEDVTMNLLVANRQQVMTGDDWLRRMKIKVCNTGNGMSRKDVVDLSASVDIDALRAYRLAVGKETRIIVSRLKLDDLRQKVEPFRIQHIWDEKAMLPRGHTVVDYWSKRDIAGLLLMPPTRHCFLHLNEARRLKQQRKP